MTESLPANRLQVPPSESEPTDASPYLVELVRQCCVPSVTPRSVDALVDAVRESTGRIRTVGSGHSFTPLAHTDGMLLSLEQLSGDVHTADTASNVATVNAGASLRTLSKALDGHGLGFKNLGDIDVQSFAGATSTATHGTGCGLPCLSAEITGMTLVLASGEQLEITEEANADLLPAAQVALGSLGIITKATVSVRPAYKLHRRTFITRINETLHAFNITHDETTEADRRNGESNDEGALRDLRRLRTFTKRTGRLRRATLNQVALLKRVLPGLVSTHRRR